MWVTICLLIVIVGLLVLQLVGLVAGRFMWYGNLVYCLWLVYFIVICSLSLYREHKRAAGPTLFQLHDHLLADAAANTSTTASLSTATGAAATGGDTSGSSLADEDKML